MTSYMVSLLSLLSTCSPLSQNQGWAPKTPMLRTFQQLLTENTKSRPYSNPHGPLWSRLLSLPDLSPPLSPNWVQWHACPCRSFSGSGIFPLPTLSHLYTLCQKLPSLRYHILSDTSFKSTQKSPFQGGLSGPPFLKLQLPFYYSCIFF